MTDLTPASPRPAKSDGTYFLLVTVLMLVILASLAFLWMRERSNRIAAQADAQQLGIENTNLKEVVNRLLLADAGSSTRPADIKPISRQELLPVTMNIGGQPRTVLILGAQTGKRLGLEPGDMIEVAQPPATQPSSRPS